MWLLSNSPHICNYFQKSYSLLSGSQREKERWIGGEKGAGPLSPPEDTPVKGRGVEAYNNMEKYNHNGCPQLCFYLCESEAAISNHSTDPWHLEDKYQNIKSIQIVTQFNSVR